ncbi:Telomeric repeat-binding factor 2-interacting protein 1 [Phytophthora citrophthora]|uniref:Telomeric repeat-binding factor 2-interacting protein 1 n=1 Tax=Phytophthora citrophthora TaxID=4793 RepID=A0AAD9LRG7_9STRA|nr:Telomeric repeat-binding factor 2-interacting protein 1 [Phytophthora citrophthora]
MAALFRGLKFYLTRTLERDTADKVQDIIEKHGGVVSASPVGAMQLVDYEKLDSRRPEWVSIDFIEESVASGTLQDPKKYSGLVFNSKPIQLKTKARVQYSSEDDARLLHFAKLRGWKSMNSMPPSTWKDAESEQVTNHSWQSMYEHFKKKLQSKTPKEQRAIMAKAVVIIRTRLRSQEAVEEEKQEDVPAEAASPTPAEIAREVPPTPATSSPPRNHNGKKARQKRKRAVESSPDDEEEMERIDDDALQVPGINFRSAWTEVALDPRRRKYLLPLFQDSREKGFRENVPDTGEPVENNEPLTEVPELEDNTDSNGEEQPVREVNAQFATETETEKFICQLQLETNQDTSCVVQALYYCSGDMNMAQAFLKGASPAGMWSPDDDLLLVSLVADENIDRSAVAAAVARGDFESMQTPRDTDEILARVQFLL